LPRRPLALVPLPQHHDDPEADGERENGQPDQNARPQPHIPFDDHPTVERPAR